MQTLISIVVIQKSPFTGLFVACGRVKDIGRVVVRDTTRKGADKAFFKAVSEKITRFDTEGWKCPVCGSPDRRHEGPQYARHCCAPFAPEKTTKDRDEQEHKVRASGID